ncbi:MAG: outer membrane beta-barrel protein [Muribaculaceae bacterium]|nr:outer membrane beta-barrel protein [Muribaculaceae bacterium]
MRALAIGLFTAAGSAMAAWAGDIRGSVADAEGEPLPQATLRLLSAQDSSFVKGVKTNNQGVYHISGIKNGKYIVEASYIGYKNGFANITVGSATVNVPKITLSDSSIELKEVVVRGVRTPIKVMEDTVEFNAASYKTQPNAVVEDLLKRLPGVEVDSEGKITANGKEVTKILVDGKEFFSDDPKVASKNLPVDMVDKLQVVDRKSDLARLTGVDDGEDETVINLTVKPGMKNGYFGTVEGGYGTDQRYKGSFNVNRFWNGNQVTLLGNFNNINELGFTDSNGGRFRRFGGSRGINTSQAVGLNFNVGKGEILRVGGDIMYSHSDRDTRQKTDRENINMSPAFQQIGKAARDKGHNVRADFRVEWKPDSFNTLDFQPNFSWNYNRSTSIDSTLNLANDMSNISRSFNDQSSDGKSVEFGARLIYNHSFRSRRGRSFSVMLNYRHSNVREHENSYSFNRFFLLNDSIDLYDQYSENHTWSDQAQARLSWTEPLGNAAKGNFLTFSYSVNYRWNNADNLIYDRPIIYPGADAPAGTMPEVDYLSPLIFNDELSNRYRNDYFNQDIRVGYKHVSKTHNLDVGMSFVPTMSKSEDLINADRNIAERWVWNYAPFLRYRYKMGKQRSLMMNYRGRSSQPSMTQLQPVADMSDPMNIIQGNPELNPTFTHSLNVRFQDFNLEHQRSIMVMGDIQMTQNSIVSKITSNPETAGRITTYENVNGIWSGRLMGMYSQPLRNKSWMISGNTFIMYNRNVGFNDGNRNISTSFNFNFSPSIAFRPENLEFELRPRYGIQTTHNSLQTSGRETKPIHNYGGTFSAYYRTPIGLILNTDLSYTGTQGYGNGNDRNEWMWNAALSYEFLRDRSLTVSVKAYDLLQQASQISRTLSGNYIDDTLYNNLPRYVMFTVSYRFNTFGKGNEPASRGGGRGGFGGPGGPGGPGGGPGGRH